MAILWDFVFEPIYQQHKKCPVSRATTRELWDDEQSSRVWASWHDRFSHDATARNDGTAGPHDAAANDDGKQRTNDARNYVSYADGNEARGHPTIL